MLKITLLSYFCTVFQIQCVSYSYNTTRFGLPRCWVLNRYLWPGAVVLDKAVFNEKTINNSKSDRTVFVISVFTVMFKNVFPSLRSFQFFLSNFVYYFITFSFYTIYITLMFIYIIYGFTLSFKLFYIFVLCCILYIFTVCILVCCHI